MEPFQNRQLRDLFNEINDRISELADQYSNDEIMGNDLSILADRIYGEVKLEPLMIDRKNITRQNPQFKKIRKYIPSVYRWPGDPDSRMVDGMSFSVHVPYSGSKILFDCQATTSLMCGYPDISLADREFLLDFEYDLSETDDDGWKIQFERELKERLDIICRGVEFTNADLASHNCGLRQRIMTALNARKKSAERFYKAVETIQIPLYKVNGAEVVIPLKKRIIPIAHTYDQEPTYRIDDSAYNDIISVIKHNCATWERTPASYKSLEEEDLRNVLLAGLNGVFQGRANGETFRYKGKTDICIEEESRSAFVAECKMWNGEKKIQEALLQLDGYLTWRDCKTALIYFVRRKDFIAIVNKVQSALLGIDCLTNVQQIDKNEVSCFMDSFSTPGQRKRVRILFFNLDHSGQEVT